MVLPSVTARLNYKMVGCFLSASALGIAVLVLACFVGSGADVLALNVTVILFGASVGWLIGVLASPYGKQETKAFSKYGTAVSAFVSGYVLSKTDHLVEHILKPDYVLTTLTGFRLLSAVVAGILALIVTYAVRAYAR